MAAKSGKTLVSRAQTYVDRTETTVDITKCECGSEARAIKTGGVSIIKKSIMDDGYKPVRILCVPTLLYTEQVTLNSVSLHTDHPRIPAIVPSPSYHAINVGVHD